VEVIVTGTADQAADVAARLIADHVRATPDLVLGLATGRTMRPVYARLMAIHRGEGLRFADVRTVNLDEYVGLTGDDEGSFRREIDERFFRHVDINPSNTHLPDGATEDVDLEAERYEKLIADLGGVDLQLLGIGRTGHIGFNEPLSPLDSRTRVVDLTPTTRRQNAMAFGGDPACVPERAITMGVATIMDARELVVVATGAAKTDIVAASLEGPVSPMVSASAIQGHPRCVVIVDGEAARGLTRRGN
jgi:glucosamine-6-phosphate deaminase